MAGAVVAMLMVVLVLLRMCIGRRALLSAGFQKLARVAKIMACPPSLPPTLVPDAADAAAVAQGDGRKECRTEGKRGGGEKLRGGQ